MERGKTNEQASSAELENLLRKIQTELDTAPGVKRQKTEDAENEVTSLTADLPGSYDDTPDMYRLIVTRPKKMGAPIKTELIHTRREVNPGVDVENITQTVVFETTHNLLGGDTVVTVVKAADKMVGTKTIYKDSNTPRFRYNEINNPFEFTQKIMGRYHQAIKPK